MARCRTQDIEQAATALAPAARKRIHTFIATSDLHLQKKLRSHGTFTRVRAAFP